MDNIYSYINHLVTAKIERPIGSRHPKYEFIYPVNYGCLPDTVNNDGKEIDVYVLGVNEPVVDTFTGKAIAVIHRTDDPDDKLVVIPEELDDISDKDIREATDFQERNYTSVIIRDENAG